MISIDASIFLGMHCQDDAIRIYCKNLVVNFLFTGIVISCEEIGKCDNVIWSRAASTQFEYFAFMDVLMTEGKFHRHTYNSELITRAFQNKEQLSVVLANTLFVKHHTISSCSSLNLENVNEKKFISNNLNVLYANSLKTRFELNQLLHLTD